MTDDWPDIEAQVRKMVDEVGIESAAAFCDRDVDATTLFRIAKGKTRRPHRATRKVIARGVRAYNDLQTQAGKARGSAA